MDTNSLAEYGIEYRIQNTAYEISVTLRKRDLNELSEMAEYSSKIKQTGTVYGVGGIRVMQLKLSGMAELDTLENTPPPI